MSKIPTLLSKRSTASDVLAHAKSVAPPRKLRVLVTGGTPGGLGFETARALAAEYGADVLLTCRTKDKAEEAARAVLASPAPPADRAVAGGSVTGVALDLTNPASVRAAAAEIQAGGPLDVIICNAGVMAVAEHKPMPQWGGTEEQMGVNVCAHYLLCDALRPALRDADSRVVLLSSLYHERHDKSLAWTTSPTLESKSYDPWTAYGNSKLMDIVVARDLHERGVKAFAVHPGVIVTNLQRHISFPLSVLFSLLSRFIADKNVEQGATTSVFAAVHPHAVSNSGGYFSDCAPAKIQDSGVLSNPETKSRLIATVRALCGLAKI